MNNNNNKNTIKLSIFFNGQFWIGVFERQNYQGYSVAQHIFGAEPTEAILYNFLLNSNESITYSNPINSNKVKTIKSNPKRRIREAKKA